jgi:hypothetical protein
VFSHLQLGLLRNSFLQAFHPECTRFSSLACTIYAPPFSSSFI